MSVYIVDAGGKRLVFSTEHRRASSPQDIAAMGAIIASIKIDR